MQGFGWPSQAPVQDSNVKPGVGYAVSVSARPRSTGRMQASGQSIRYGVLRT